MTTMTILCRKGLKAGALIVLTAACFGAHAHAYLQRSEPPASAALTRLPPELRLRFSEAVEPAFIELHVLRDGADLGDKPAPKVDKDGKTVRVALPAAAADAVGEYEVQWRIVAKDGHPTEGRFKFRVGAR